MIEITTDVTKLSDAEYGVLIAFMNDLRQLQREKAPAVICGDAPSAASVRTIDPADSPAAGVDAREVFAQPAEPTAAQVFGGNGAPSTAVAGPPAIAPAAMPAISTNPTASAIPAPPPANVAPIAAPPAPPAAPAPGVELDKNGLPWDGRNHASTKRKNADGSWTARRNTDPAVVAAVEGELRAAMSAGSPAAPAPAPTIAAQPGVAVAPSPSSIAPDAAALAAPAAPVPTAPAPAISMAAVANPSNTPNANGAPAAPAAIPPAPGTNPEAGTPAAAAPAQSMTFPQLAPKITAGLSGGTLTQAQVTAALHAVGLPALPMLINRPDLVPHVAAQLGLA